VDIPKKLLDYVKLARQRNLPEEEIKYILVNRGWSEKQVAAALKLARKNLLS
jgi:beta-N-acetylglucosaminidase